MKKGGTTSTRPLVKKTKGLFYFKDVRRVGQLQAAKVSGMSENPLFFKIFQDRPA